MVNGIDGVAMVNPTAIGGEFWYLSAEPHTDPRFNCPDITGNYTDGFQCPVAPALITVETSLGYTPGSVSKNVNHSFIASAGFMYASNDWRDVEWTGYFDCRGVTNSDARIQFFARSAEVDTERQWCPGSFYMGELAMDGRFRWVKGQYHLSCFQKDWIDSLYVGLSADLTTRPLGWFGIKIIMSNVDIGDERQGVQLRLYVDKNNSNSWSLVGQADLVDNGGWGSDDQICGGYKDQIITWGGPLASLRLERGEEILFNKLSVREIGEGGQFIAPLPTAQAQAAATGAFQRLIGMITLRYKIGVFTIPTCIGEIPTDPDPPPGGPGDPDPPPPGGTTFVEMRLAHKFDINRSQQSIINLEEFPTDLDQVVAMAQA